MDNNNESIHTMIKIKNLLECHSCLINSNIEYSKIYNDVIQYLEKYCKHHIVSDLIDIDGDRSISIEYCEICHTTLKK